MTSSVPSDLQILQKLSSSPEQIAKKVGIAISAQQNTLEKGNTNDLYYQNNKNAAID